MKLHFVVGTLLSVALLATGSVRAEDAAKVKSGPQVGQEVPGPFHPLNINGKEAGKKHCLFCENGSHPVAMIFARDAECPQLASLIKKIDAATVQNTDKKMGSFVVFLGEQDVLEPKLKEMAEKAALKKTVLSIDNPAGPKNYEVSKDADVTVVLYTDRNVKANYAYGKGKLNEKAIDKIVADVKKILPE